MQKTYHFNCYEVLGIHHTATTEQIKSAHTEKMKVHHPDKHNNAEPANEMAKMINEAKEILLDPAKREEHDIQFNYKKGKPEIVEKPIYINRTNTVIKKDEESFAKGALTGLGIAAVAALIVGFFSDDGK